MLWHFAPQRDRKNFARDGKHVGAIRNPLCSLSFCAGPQKQHNFSNSVLRFGWTQSGRLRHARTVTFCISTRRRFPVDAFWSLTMYDAQGFQIANPINRFAIGDRDAFKYEADGSLDLYIQHDDPGADHHANWLPGPTSGELGLTMRLYAPRAEAFDGRWAPPPLRRQQ